MGWRPLLRLLSCIVYALITRNITWQRVSPEPPVPAQMNDSLSMEEGGSEAKRTTEARRIKVVGGWWMTWTKV